MSTHQKLNLLFSLKQYIEYDTCSAVVFTVNTGNCFSLVVSKRGFLLTTLGSSIYVLDSHVCFENPMEPTGSETEMHAMLSGRGSILIDVINLCAFITREQAYFTRQSRAEDRLIKVVRKFVTVAEDIRVKHIEDKI